MTTSRSAVRRFDTTASTGHSQRLGDHDITITSAVEASEGGPLSAYSARFGPGERAELPASYHEVWVIVRGRLRILSGDSVLVVGVGQYVHVPEDSPGEVEALEETVLVSVSVPAH